MLSKTQAKYIQSLVHKKFRDQYGQYIIEGPKLLSEAISTKANEISRIYALPDWITEHPLFHRQIRVDIVPVTEADMKKISTLYTPGPVLAVMQMPQKQEITAAPGITLLLDAIQDPGNMGTIIRTADWFGIRNIICGEGCVDCYNPKVIQSTMGSIFRTNIIYHDLTSFIALWPDIPVMASSLEGTLISEVRKEQQTFLVIGNESRGIRPDIMKKATVLVKIPGSGDVDSLNAAVATGILLFWLTVGG